MIAILLSCAVLCLVILFTRYYNGKGNLPPLAGGALPIVGHAWLGFVKRERLYEALVNTLEPSFQSNVEVVGVRIGTITLYICMDPDDAYLVAKSCLQKDALYRFTDALFGGKHGLINADVRTWKVHRKLLNPAFNQSILDSYFSVFNAQSRHLVELLTQEVGKEYFDQIPYMNQTLRYVIRETILGAGRDEDDLMLESGKAAEVLTSCVVERITKFYYHSDFLFKFSNLKKKQDNAFKTTQSLMSKAIRNKRATMSRQEYKTDTSSPRFKSFLELMLEVGDNGVLSEAEIQQELTTLLGAAYDTTYHALAMMLLNIGSYPEIQQKIFDELQAVFEGSMRDVERQDMSKLKYLDAVCRESMRLYPVVFAVGRTVETDLKLKSYTLPAGSSCFMSIYHLGRHRVWGADAAQFRPERWLDGSLPADFRAFAAFGLGRRSCIGSNFAMMLMKTVLSHVVRQYRISGDVTRLVQYFDVVATPVSGHHISLQQRK